MAITRRNHRGFHRSLYAGVLQPVTLLKRDDNQAQGTVRAVRLFEARRRQISKTGQTIGADFNSDQRTTWVFALSELLRNGVEYITQLDRIVDGIEGGTWMPESRTNIQVKLQGLIISVECLRTDDA